MLPRRIIRRLEPVLVFVFGYFFVDTLLVSLLGDPLPVGPVYLPLTLLFLSAVAFLTVGLLDVLQGIDFPFYRWLPPVLAPLILLVKSPGINYLLEGYTLLFPLMAFLGGEYIVNSSRGKSVEEWGVILTLLLVLPAQWIREAQDLVDEFTVTAVLTGIVMTVSLVMVIAVFRWTWSSLRGMRFRSNFVVTGGLIVVSILSIGLWAVTWETPRRQAGLYEFQPRFEGTRPEASLAGETREKQRPSVVLVSIDTLRWDMVPPRIRNRKLPALRQLRRDSTTFTKAFSSSGWTLPAHASLFTGVSPIEHGAVLPDNYIYDFLPLYPQVFRELGYSTAGFTDGGYVSRVYGFQRGFDTLWEQVLPFSTSADDWVLPGATETLITLQSTLMEDPLKLDVNEFPNHRYFTRNLHEARTWWSNRPNRPKFLFLHTYQLHDYGNPYPENYRRLRKNRPRLARTLKGPDDASPARENQNDTAFRTRYRAALRHLYEYGLQDVDRALGDFVAWLKDRGEYRDTLVVLVSDHGEGLQYRYDVTGHSGKLHEVLTRVPVWIKWPGNEPAGDVSDLVQLRDVFPVVFENLGIRIEEFPGERLGPSDFVTRNTVAVPRRDRVRSSVAWKVNADSVAEHNRQSRIEVREENYKVRSGTSRKARTYLSLSGNSLGETVIPRTSVPPETARSLDAGLREFQTIYSDFPNPFLRTNREVDEDFRDRLRGLGYFQ